MAKKRLNKIEKIRAATVVLFLCFTSWCFFSPRLIPKTFGSDLAAAPEQTQRRNAAQTKRAGRYADFPHNVHTNRLKIACDACHKFPTSNWKSVRKADAAFPDVTDFPKHESCINCHREQFFRGNPPQICSICHTNPSPRDSSRHAFPNPPEIFDQTARGQRSVSEFEIGFPHDKHIEIVSQNENAPNQNSNGVRFVNAAVREENEQSCAVCHQTYKPQGESDDEYATKPPAKLGDRFWLKKGAFKTEPTSHAQCFTCHSTDAGIKPAPIDCATCHKLKQSETGAPDFDVKLATTMNVTDKIMLSAWRTRHSAGAFRHEFASHAELSCSTCHNVAQMNTIDQRTKKVPVLSCAPCHITARSDDGGALNFEIDARAKDAKFQCSKCHVAYGKAPIPESHVKAIAAQK